MNATTVFLKVDTRRVPVSFSFEDSARTLVIGPLRPLDLRRTYTIEFTPRVRTATGVAFEETFFWQFTTVSVRRIENPDPPDGRELESPVAPLFWSETEGGAGPVEYQLFFGPDSAQVAGATTPSLTSGFAYYLPPARWSADARVFWKVRVRNVETGDEALGPVWRFHVASRYVPVDSMLVRVRDFGSWDSRTRSWTCGSLGSNTAGAFAVTGDARFDLAALDSNLVVADAFMVMSGTDPETQGISPRFPELGAIDQAWVPCDPQFGVPPASQTVFATGVLDGNGRVRFASDLLAAQIQGRIRRHSQLFDYAFRSRRLMSYVPLEAGSGIRIYCYDLPSAGYR